MGMSWAERRQKFDVLTDQHGQDLLDQVLLNDTTPLPAELIRSITDSILSTNDFKTLSTLSSSGPFAKVELVKPIGLRKSEVQGQDSDHGRKVFVMKAVEKKWAIRMRAQQSPRNELTILRYSLQIKRKKRPPIPELVASFFSPTHFHLVLSHEPGGDLWTVLERVNEGEDSPKGLDEKVVKRWMSELVEAIEWLWSEGWVHRDIKPHNLLLSSTSHLILTDFGSACPHSTLSSYPPGSISTSHARALVGTPDYVPPEILEHAEKVALALEEDEDGSFDSERETVEEVEDRAYGMECDLWSLGVVVYELLFGQAPFFTESIAETYDKIVNCSDTLIFPPLSYVSRSAQALIKRLLTKAETRISAKELKKHSWFVGEPWGRLDAAPPLYHAPPFVAASTSSPKGYNPNTTVASSVAQGGGGAFDFSAFFSSPGLSILRPSPSAGAQAKEEEQEFWKEMITLPDGNRFEELGSDQESQKKAPALKKVAALDEKRRVFETPLRGPSTRSVEQGREREQEGQKSSGRSKRMVNDVEAWREMQEHAWEIGRTAKKKKVRATPLRKEKQKDELDELAGRHQGVLKDLDGLEDKYKSLFKLVATQ